LDVKIFASNITHPFPGGVTVKKHFKEKFYDNINELSIFS
jgi:hypothetical protein